jgi:hypothetical protein
VLCGFLSQGHKLLALLCRANSCQTGQRMCKICKQPGVLHRSREQGPGLLCEEECIDTEQLQIKVLLTFSMGSCSCQPLDASGLQRW